MGGNTALAEEIVQTVFLDTARHAQRLTSRLPLAGWLYRHTCFVASKTLRSENRRRARERAAAEMNTSPADTGRDTAWDQLVPLLDQALNWLSARDRDAVVQRFFLGQDFGRVGQILGISEDAAQKRVARALGKLKHFFARRGVATTVPGLAAFLAAQAVGGAPPGLAATVAASAVSAAVPAGIGTAFLLHVMTTTKLKMTLTGLALAALITPLIQQHRALGRLRMENALQRQQLEHLRLENDALIREQPDSDEVARRQREHNELVRLRGELSRLRFQVQQRPAPRPPGRPKPHAQDNPASPVRTFTATLQSRVQPGQSLITGGWSTRTGKRTFVLVTPVAVQEGAAAQIMLTTKLVEASDELLPALGLESFTEQNLDTSQGGILSDTDLKAILETVETSDGAQLLAAPRLTTVSGQQAQIQVAELRSIPGVADPVTVGPTIDVIPTWSADDGSIDLTLMARINVLDPQEDRE